MKIIYRAPFYQKPNSSIGRECDGDPINEGGTSISEKKSNSIQLLTSYKTSIHEGGGGTSTVGEKETNSTSVDKITALSILPTPNTVGETNSDRCDVILKESVPAGRRTCFLTSKSRTQLNTQKRNTDLKPFQQVSFCSILDDSATESDIVPCEMDAIFDCVEQEALAHQGNCTLMNIVREKKHIFYACRYENEKRYMAVHVRNTFKTQYPSARFLSKSRSDTWHELCLDDMTDIIILLFEGHESCVYKQMCHDFVLGDASIHFKLPCDEDAIFGCVEGTTKQQRGNLLLMEMIRRKKHLFHTCRFGAEKRYIATSIHNKFKATLPSARFLHQPIQKHGMSSLMTKLLISLYCF